MPNTNFTTLCYIECEDSYLMLHRVKKEGDMNRDKWLGVGGHFEKGESPEVPASGGEGRDRTYPVKMAFSRPYNVCLRLFSGRVYVPVYGRPL